MNSCCFFWSSKKKNWIKRIFQGKSIYTNVMNVLSHEYQKVLGSEKKVPFFYRFQKILILFCYTNRNHSVKVNVNI